HFRAPCVCRCRCWTPNEIAAAGFGDEREYEIAMRVEIVDHDQQLPESGLAEVVDQKLCVAASQLGWRRLLELRPATNQVPQHAPAVLRRRARPERRLDRTPPERSTLGTPAAGDRSADGADANAEPRAPQNQHDEPGQPGG